MMRRIIDYWDTIAYWKISGRSLSLWQRMNFRFRAWYFKIVWLHPKYRCGLSREETKTLREVEKLLKELEHK